MVTLTVWQCLALAGVGGMLTLAGLGWLITATSARQEGAPGGCFGRVITALSLVSALGLLVVALVR